MLRQHDYAGYGIMKKLWYCDTIRQQEIVTEQERSLAISTRPSPSHAIRKAKSVKTATFLAKGYYSESGCEEFKSVAVRI